VFDGQPIANYWAAWKGKHGRGERFPHGESLDGAARRYAAALRRLVGRSEAVTLIVGHELAIRYPVEAAAGVNDLGVSEMGVPNATPYFFDEAALRNAVEWLDELAAPLPRDQAHTEVGALAVNPKGGVNQHD
jgi:broad specificity phosphatase PhoE